MSKTHDHDNDPMHIGLSNDLNQLLRLAGRRRVLKVLAGVAVLPLLKACGADGTGTGGTGSTLGDSSTSGDSTGACATIPEETEGPYPGDGSNGKNALTLSGIVRSDIRSSVAGVSGVADGIELVLNLQIVDSTNACNPLVGYAVYVWHCNRDGQYSLYGLPSQNYLRGVQETDASGNVQFTTIFPACYSGRMPHIHIEIYPTVESATSYHNKIATTQLAFPDAPCRAVFATAGYEASVTNYTQTSFAKDMVFSDGYSQELATVTGDVDAGFAASLLVPIAG